MVTQINPFMQQVWRSLSQLQIGTAGESITFEGLSAAEERFIASVTSGIAEGQIEPLARQLKLDSQSASQLVSTLKPILLKKIMQQPDQASRQNAELVRATLNANDDGFELLARRSTKTIYLNQLSRPGVAIASSLAAAKIEKFHSDDKALVGQQDGYFESLVGCRRSEALEYLLSQFGHKSKVLKQSSEKSSISVLIAQQIIWPRTYAPIMYREQPHIGVVFNEFGVTVSPLVLPGETACLFCLEQAKIATDSAWPAIASQLVSSDLCFDDTAANNFAAATVTKLITDWVDLRIAGVGKRWNGKTGEITSFEISASSSCDCLIHTRLEQVEESRPLAS